MAICKLVKLEVMLLIEERLSDEEIVRWVKTAIQTKADFKDAAARIIESHENVMMDGFGPDGSLAEG